MFEYFIDASERKAKSLNLDFKRYLFNRIDDNERLIGLTGARGVGKTTLLLQKLKEKNLPIKDAIYISMDDAYFLTNRLVTLANEFAKNGGKYLFLDEVHKYIDWSIELKNIYDNFPELKIMFTGSSVIEISKTQGDLSRRADIYKLETMSFREYLSLELNKTFPTFTINEIIANHEEICNSLLDDGLLPYKYFENFLKYGAYPFYLEGRNRFWEKLRNTINLIVENELPATANIDFLTGIKIKKLLIAISESVPFKPNMGELAARIETDRRNVYAYLDLLTRSRLINTLISDEKGISALSKPEMVYLENTSLAYALNNIKPEKGMLRETFFYNQLNSTNHISYTPAGDFLVDNAYIFEVGGRNKKFKQIKNLPKSYLAIDELETGHGNKIPLWIFGFVR